MEKVQGGQLKSDKCKREIDIHKSDDKREGYSHEQLLIKNHNKFINSSFFRKLIVISDCKEVEKEKPHANNNNETTNDDWEVRRMCLFLKLLNK